MNIRWFISLLLAVFCGTAWGGDVVVNGDFEKGADGWALGWDRPVGGEVMVGEESGNHFARFKLDGEGSAISGQKIALDPAWKLLDVSVRLRGREIMRGKQGWQTARLEYLFEDKDGRHVGAWPWVGLWEDGSTDGWKVLRDAKVRVPEGAVALRLGIGLWVANGTLDVDDVVVKTAGDEVVAAAGGADAPAEVMEEWGKTAAEAISAHRGRMGLEGRWQFQPGNGDANKAPVGEAWGVARVPGNWDDANVVKAAGWEGFDPKTIAKGWYKRSVTVPAEWAGRGMVLRLDRVSTDARVWVNGQDAGEVRWPAGTVDVSNQIKAGERNEIQVMVVATADASSVTQSMKLAEEPVMGEGLAARGLIGGVELLARPKGGYVADVLVRTSTRQKRVEVDVELANVSRHGQVKFVAEMLNEAGEIEKTFEQTLPLSVARIQKITAGWDWADARLFDVGRPNRYTMRLRVSGPTIEDEYVQGFGFREFWIEGTKFYLNGTEIRLRPGRLGNGVSAQQLLERGYNYGETPESNRTARGSAAGEADGWITEADRVGLLVGAELDLPMDHGKDASRRVIEVECRQWWNSPSVMMWFGRGDEQSVAMVKSIDSTRPVYLHGGGGDVEAVEWFEPLMTLHERERWFGLRGWEKPLMVVEMGVGPGMTREGINHPVEWSAGWLGEEAYRLGDGAYDKVLEQFVTGIWRSWRTLGITGGMIPGRRGESRDWPGLAKVNGPALAWIAGGGEGVDGIVEKSHIFSVGQTVSKRVALLNDFRESKPATYEWKALVGEKEIASGKNEAAIELSPAQTMLTPFLFTLPDQIEGEKSAGRIEMKAKIGEVEQTDSFGFVAYGPIANSGGVVSVFDPAGKTTAMLVGLGYEVKAWTEGNATGEVVVIGLDALSGGQALPGEIQTYLANGGRVVVMGQGREWMKKATGLRMIPMASWRVFGVDGNHAVLAGLDENDLRDWNGNGGVVTAGAIEKPHLSGLRAILQSDFDLSCSPLMEMDYGRGRLIWCALDLETNAQNTPSARKLAKQLMEYARTGALSPRAERVVYLGGAEDAATLGLLGVKYEKVESMDRPADLVILGRGAAVEDSMIAALAGQGAKVLVMRHDQPGEGALGAVYEKIEDYKGSLEVPGWPVARGLGVSDVRWRTGAAGVVLKSVNDKIEYGAGGQLGRMPVGQGLVVFCQFDPGAVGEMGLTRLRQGRALGQVLVNMGAAFKGDDRLVEGIEGEEGKAEDLYLGRLGDGGK